MDTETKLTLLGTVFAGLFSGASIYINIVEHPARLSCGADIAHAQWMPSYKRAAKWQASLAFLGGLVGVVNYFKNKNKLSLKAGLLLASVIPFTLIAIMPTNKILLGQQQLEQETKLSLLTKWGQLHAVRTVASLISFGIFLFALAKK
ncbi:unnamed protein product (macronuclear) [Paramecium tetraurelia]|uniref:DUF1772 domain-containing protein n=1 Tax=Paramecium tetraurelia TaxID=5888 RepID=A0CBD4_PARTE|nr:uncharacterized protein GSPATT00036884001 [Paramecium tetraurelia]CAK68101.1 unnamed protein product [Paramecium tetraurelia]|eukprot:XP_001435498.1 hypothetical protein (macronuclear) [Paramecium tetraurelia strain d4-2]